MSADNVTPIYAAHLYPPEAIPVLLQARDLVTQAHILLCQLCEEGKIKQGEPASYACDLLDEAINYLEPEEDDEAPVGATLRLIVDNPQPEKPS